MMKIELFLVFLLISCISFAQEKGSGGQLSKEQAAMDIRHYTLDLTVNPNSQSYGGSTTIDLKLVNVTPSLIFDLDNRFFVSEILVNGKNMPYNHYNGKIHIPGTPNFSLGDYNIKISYNGEPKIAKNPPWDGGIQWSKDAQGRPWIAMSCQEDGANIFFPCKDHPSDEPNEGADLNITVPKGLVVAGPGFLVSTEDKNRQTVFHWKTNYTINNYCIVFNIGYYKPYQKNYTTIEGNIVPMQYYVLDYNYDKAEKHLELLERSTRMLEKYFGEYPFVKEKIGLVETPHLGMEHQTMNAYGNKYRYEKVGDVDFDWLMHHEFGHEWWANKVSNIDWAHMWVQEGITSFADALFTEEFAGKDAYIQRMKKTGASLKNQLPVVQAEEGVDGKKTYHSDIYGKGAFFMHTLRFVMGDSVFFPALKAFIMDPKYTYNNFVSTKDLQLHLSKWAKKDLSPLFKLFIYSTDKLKINLLSKENGKYEISLQNLDMTIPMDITTDAGTKTINISKKPITINSKTLPIIDENGFYLKSL